MIAVVIIVVDEKGRYLLIQESKDECRGKWFLPGGKTNIGESITDAAIREAKEETGVDIELSSALILRRLDKSSQFIRNDLKCRLKNKFG